jgi:glucose-1-phosphate thymidylyltransferase
MWGIIPAAGQGSRIQPLAFSKELLPVGGRDNDDRPKAVSEYLVERLTLAGADKLCFVISPGKSDIMQYYGGRVGRTDIAYVVQPTAAGLCDALFRARPLVHPAESVAVGLPDTVWFPQDGLLSLPEDQLAFLLFPVDRPELFDAVVTDGRDRVQQIQVKSVQASSRWIWGAFRMPGEVFHELYSFWHARGEREAYVGTLINAWLEQGGKAVGVRAGERYVDVGTLHGYREAIRLLAKEASPGRLMSGSTMPQA